MTEAQLKAKYESMLEKAYKAQRARNVLETALENLKKSKNWKKFCEVNDVSHNSDVGDWMC
jgi:hypothetical protein